MFKLKQFHEKRLLKLADYLQSIKKSSFNMGWWKRDNCQTVACACGHACNIPSFKRAGLTLRFKDEFEGITTYDLVFKDEFNFNAAKEFFGLPSVRYAEYLFSPSEYRYKNNCMLFTNEFSKITPKIVANRIRKFVKWIKSGKDGLPNNMVFKNK